MARDARRSRTNRIQPLAETTAAATINRPRARSSVPCRSMGTERVPETPWWACRRSSLRFAVAEAASGSSECDLALLVELGDRVGDHERDVRFAATCEDDCQRDRGQRDHGGDADRDERPPVGERPPDLLRRLLIPAELCLEVVDLLDQIAPLRAGRIDYHLEVVDLLVRFADLMAQVPVL